MTAAVLRPALAPAKKPAQATDDALAPLPDGAYTYTAPERHLDAMFARPGMIPAAKDPPRHFQLDITPEAQEAAYGQRLGHGWTAGAFVRNDDDNGLTGGLRFDRRW